MVLMARSRVGPLHSLRTREEFCRRIAPLAAARANGQTLRDLLDDLPPRVTAADRLSPVSPPAAAQFLAALTRNEAARMALLAKMHLPAPVRMDLTDGLRMTFSQGRVLHLRTSGNSPAFRLYHEEDSGAAANALINAAVYAVGAVPCPVGGLGGWDIPYSYILSFHVSYLAAPDELWYFSR